MSGICVGQNGTGMCFYNREHSFDWSTACSVPVGYTVVVMEYCLFCASWVHSSNGDTACCVQTDKLHAQLRRLRNESSVLKDAVITAIPSHYSRVFFTCARVTSPVRGVDFGAQQPAQSTDSGVSCHLKFLTFSNREQHTHCFLDT